LCFFLISLFIAKGKGGEQALKLVEGVDGLDLVLVMVPFFYSNFLAFFTPNPINPERTQWELAACFGDGSTKIDMMNVSDLGVLVRKYKSKISSCVWCRNVKCGLRVCVCEPYYIDED
jgi:hypothetical protein